MTEYSVYRPDKWVVLKITNGYKVGYKVLGGWKGGYLDGDHWRLNSGIRSVDVSKDGNYFFFEGHSGSIYGCHKDAYGFTTQTAGIYNMMTENHHVPLSTVELMPEDTNWMELVL